VRARRNPLPCPPGLLCGYLSVLAERGLPSPRSPAAPRGHRPSAPQLWPGAAQRQRGRPTGPPGIRRELGVAPKRKAPATDDLVRRIMALPRVEKGLYRPCTTPI